MAQNLMFYRGDTVGIPFTLTGVNLTGTTVYFTAKPIASIVTDSTADAAAIIAVQTTTHTDPINGNTVINLTPTQTNVLPGTYDWDLQTKDISGNIQTRVGKVLPQLTVLADVTRRTT